ncbi:P-loop containing nucleoside triphosphate hydrolase protein [Scheffersomyces xylosifermentans]|uniref:P-loop containing nucleoside triphosphate hydrolase protein n=1 Tax=Scheffersomyces xylosifermentans TaxID=1304137 RepID=UPI00315C75FB
MLYKPSIRCISTTTRKSIPYVLRDYQKSVIDAVHRAIERGVRRQAVVMATGGGKTVIFAHLIDQLKPATPSRGNKTLVLAHSRELIQQSASTIAKANPHLKVEMEMANFKTSEDADVVVASVPTLNSKDRINKFNKEEFKTIILDECHHAVARTWMRVLQYFEADKPDSDIYVLGFTATLERADNMALSNVFDEIVYERSTKQMIDEGDLSEMKFSAIDIDVNFRKVELTEVDVQNSGSSKSMDLKQANLVVAVAYMQLRKQHHFKSTMVFCVDIEHCKTLCGVLQEQGVVAQYITGKTAKIEREAILDDFKNGRIEVLCNVSVFTEGTDIPNIDSLFIARPTKSRGRLVQMIGRGLRKHHSKTICHVVDFSQSWKTGVNSVPTLEGTMELFDKLSIQSSPTEVDSAVEERKESSRIIEEMLTAKFIDGLDQQEYWYTFTTYDGISGIENIGKVQSEDNSMVNKSINESTVAWIRLEYHVWAAPNGRDRFIHLQRNVDEDGHVDFVLSIKSFYTVPNKSYITKIGNVETIEESSDINTVLREAEKLPNVRGMYRPHKSELGKYLITKKQLLYLQNKLGPKVKKFYGEDSEIMTKFETQLARIDGNRASNLIFAYKYSANSLFIRWELNKLLGYDKKAKKSLKRISESNSQLVNRRPRTSRVEGGSLDELLDIQPLSLREVLSKRSSQSTSASG